MRTAQEKGCGGAPPGLIETFFSHSRTSSDRKWLIVLIKSHPSAPAESRFSSNYLIKGQTDRYFAHKKQKKVTTTQKNKCDAAVKEEGR